jgi:cytochrome c oxidase subunit II
MSHRMTPEDKGREPVPDSSRPGDKPVHASPRPGEKGRGRVPGSPRRALHLALLLALPLVASGCGLVKPGLDPKAQEVHDLWYTILWLAIPVFVFVWGMLAIVIVRYRRRRGDETEPVQTRGHPAALTTFFAAPLAIIVLLLAFGEVTVNRVDSIDSHPAERLVVTGSQWQWSGRYVKEGLSVSGKTASDTFPGKPLTMAVPLGRSVEVTLESTDVIHGFFVPGMLFMKNAVPGHPSVFTFTPTRAGTYHGQCTQFCGLWHSKMTLVLKVLPPAQFQAWVRQQKQAQSSTGSCTPTGSSITLTAQHISWDKKCIAAVAGAPIRVTVINKDAGVAHNFAIWVSSSLKKRLYQTPNLNGPATKTFIAPALPPGKYYFQCDVHGPAMSGTLIIGNKSS